MTKQLDITPEAERDISAITLNILQQVSPQAAKLAAHEFMTQLTTLTTSADAGRPGGCEGTSEIVLTGLPYIAVYEISHDAVTIVRILYGADDRP